MRLDALTVQRFKLGALSSVKRIRLSLPAGCLGNRVAACICDQHQCFVETRWPVGGVCMREVVTGDDLNPVGTYPFENLPRMMSGA